MDIKDGLLGKVPFVTIGLAIAMTIGFGMQLFDAEEQGGEYEALLLRAQTFYERNGDLEVTGRQRNLLGSDFVEQVDADHAAAGGTPVFSARIRQRTQKKFEAICDQAIEARTKEDPAWRHGITGTEVPVHRYFTYAFFHDGVLAFAVTLVFLLLVGLGLETTWGPLFFAPVSALAIVAGGAVFAFGDAASHVPMSGGGPLVAALLAAYVVRGSGGHLPLPGALLLATWFFVDVFFVRGIWIDNVGDWPWLTLSLSMVLGAGISAGIRVMGVEAKLVDVAESLSDGRHPAIAEAESLTIMGRLQDAFALLSEAAAEHPGDATLALACWNSALETGRSDEVVDAILPILQSELRTGDIELATLHWRQVMATRVPVEVSTTVLVRMGEALLDVSEPEEALDCLRRALDSPGTMGSALAQRVVRIARDLDPVLTGRAADVALRDPQIDAETRAELESLVGGGTASPSRASVAPATSDAASHGTTAALAALADPSQVTDAEIDPMDDLSGGAELGADIDDSDIDLSHVGDLSSPEDFEAVSGAEGLPPMELDAPGAQAALAPETDPNALSIHSLEVELASGLDNDPGASATDPAGWNDPGLVEDLSGELDSAQPSLIDEADLAAPGSDDSYLDPGALSAEALSDAVGDAPAETASTDSALPPLAAQAIGPDEGAEDLLGDATDPLQQLRSELAPADRETPPTEPLLDSGSMEARGLAAEADLAATDAASNAMAEDALGDQQTAAADMASLGAAAGIEPPAEAPMPAVTPAASAPPQPRETRTERPAEAPMRALKVLDALPLALEADAMKFDVEGRGKTRLPFARIDAVSVAAVSGLSAKPVLVIDFVLNWNGDANEPLKVIRARSDGFNPASLVGAGGSPLEAIKTLIRRVLDGAQAIPLPDAGAAMGSPFSVHADLESYQRDVLLAS